MLTSIIPLLCVLIYSNQDHPFKGWFEKAPIRGVILATPEGVVSASQAVRLPALERAALAVNP
jgi:hypothetical protein